MPSKEHAAFVGRHDARHGFYKRGFASAIFAQNAMDAAGIDIEIGLFKGTDTTVALRYAFQTE